MNATRTLGTGWKTLANKDFTAQVLAFGEGSEYGIHEGRISKLWIKDNATGQTVCNYDRGWDTEEPKSGDHVMHFYTEILEKYN